MDNYKQISLTDVANALVAFYKAVSSNIAHDDEPQYFTWKSKEWNAIFEKIKYTNPINKKIVMKTFEPIEPDDLRGLCLYQYKYVVVFHDNMILNYPFLF